MIDLYEDLGETARRQILAELGSGPRNVSQIVAATGLKQPNVSNHLARMRTRGVVIAEKTGREVFYRFASPQVESIVMAVLAPRPASTPLSNLSELAAQYAEAGILGEEARCSEIVDSVFAHGVPLLDIYEDVIGQAMGLVGNWYKSGRIDEAQEHMASEITEQIIGRVARLVGPPRRLGKTAVLGCAANSWHLIGLRMISDVMRLRGWRTLFLGANVPTPSFLNAVDSHHAELTLISCAAEEGWTATKELVEGLAELRARGHTFSIGLGGNEAHLHESELRALGANFLATDLRSFVRDVLPSIEASPK